MRRLLPAALVAAVLLLSGCDADDVPSPGEAKVDVDTLSLRNLKTEAGIADCVPGSADRSTADFPTSRCRASVADPTSTWPACRAR